jgi:nitrogen regulatory protein P-II 1
MIRIDAVVPQNDIRAISDALKKIQVGGITIVKVRGRGKTAGPGTTCCKRHRDIHPGIYGQVHSDSDCG